MADILIIEDNEAQRSALNEFLSGAEFKKESLSVTEAADGRGALEVLDRAGADIVICDLMLPDMTGIDIIKKTKEKQSLADIPFLILTGQPSIETAVEAIKAGAGDYLLKPVDLRLLKKKVESLLEVVKLKIENQELRRRVASAYGTHGIIGNSLVLREVIEKAEQIAPTEVTVLLEGESGTGKEMFANLLHQNSRRSDRPFIKVNCGALTKTILESELFGVTRGAYTGADRDREGFFETADGGTIFLDEIGEMDLESQVRLLRVIE